MAGFSIVMLWMIVIYLIIAAICVLWGIASYVMTSLSVYTIAKRRNITKPWLAWVPVANVWTLGSLSDQYRYVTKGQVRNSRKALIVLEILKFLAAIASIVAIIICIVQAASNISRWEMMQGEQLLHEMLGILVPLLIAFGIWAVIALIKLVVTTVAYYDLFASCDPQNKVLFLVLGLLIAVIVVVVIALMDGTIHDEEYVMRTYDYPILGKVPDLLGSGNKSYGYYTQKQYNANT